MKLKSFAIVATTILIFGVSVLKGEELQQDEILQIFRTLTDQPKSTWIPHGTIEAEHQEFNLHNGYSANTSVVVSYDGNRFYWEINTNSFEETGQPALGRDVNESLGWSKKRVFAWDGEEYTMYFGPGKQAVVTADTSQIPVEINGPLTAGVIPWGLGIYTYDSLSSAELSGVELDVDGQKKIYLEIKMPRIPEMYFTLDPLKGYAVLSHSFITDTGYSIAYTCSDYQLVSDSWVPQEILIEEYDYNKNPVEMFSRNYWNLNSIDTDSPSLSAFNVSYDKGTLVQYYLEMSKRPLSYHHSSDINIDDLFHESMLNSFREDSLTQNCATAALKYAASKCDKDIADSNLAQLVTEPNQVTSLYSMKDFIHENGLYCKAVRTDIKGLKELKDNYQLILHFPEIDHYVVLHDIDEKYVWLIDLNRKHFFYRKKIKHFSVDWGEGTAFLVSKEATMHCIILSVPMDLATIPVLSSFSRAA
ncbi:MAG: cysteine peptidase family C39 domain-containing protein [Planctomycetota bacterium]|jgi:hypothetical protein